MNIKTIQVKLSIRFLDDSGRSVGEVNSPVPAQFSNPNQLLQFSGAFYDDVLAAGRLLRSLRQKPEDRETQLELPLTS
jgi:hypothetical protein